MPAKAGIQAESAWTPAFAGVTEKLEAGLIDAALALQEIAVAAVGADRGPPGRCPRGEIDLVAGDGAPRLALRLERLPDHRRARVAARPFAEHAAAGAPVDPHHP